MKSALLTALCALVIASAACAGSHGPSGITTTSAGASWLTTNARSVAPAALTTTGLTTLLSDRQVVTQLGRMVTRHGARVTRITESRAPSGSASFMVHFEVPGMMSKLGQVSMSVYTNKGGEVEHVSEPTADFQP